MKINLLNFIVVLWKLYIWIIYVYIKNIILLELLLVFRKECYLLVYIFFWLGYSLEM